MAIRTISLISIRIIVIFIIFLGFIDIILNFICASSDIILNEKNTFIYKQCNISDSNIFNEEYIIGTSKIFLLDLIMLLDLLCCIFFFYLLYKDPFLYPDIISEHFKLIIEFGKLRAFHLPIWTCTLFLMSLYSYQFYLHLKYKDNWFFFIYCISYLVHFILIPFNNIRASLISFVNFKSKTDKEKIMTWWICLSGLSCYSIHSISSIVYAINNSNSDSIKLIRIVFGILYMQKHSKLYFKKINEPEKNAFDIQIVYNSMKNIRYSSEHSMKIEYK